jgi:GTP-binding protein Era
MTTPPKPGPKRTQTQAALDPDDERLLSALPKEVPCILLLNKVDLLRDKRKLLPVMEAFHERHDFAAVIPISALSEDGLDLVLSAITERLPEGPGVHSADTLTDRPARFFVREYVREQVMRHTKSEVPHAVAITVERFVERPGITEISATIHVEKDGQKAIVVGRGGSMIKQIGIAARERLQELLGTRVHLELFVRVTPQWKDTPRQLAEIGYDTPGGRSLTHLLPGTDERRRRKPAAKAKSAAAPPQRGKPRRRAARRGRR